MFDTVNDCDRAQRQAPQQAYTWMVDSIEYIDREFGEGYARKHPEFLMDFMKVAAQDQHAVHTYNVAKGLEMVANEIGKMSSEVGDIESTLRQNKR
tara:strand:+ start:993 stop:1280 length:288 start_codon:yes stop_codon:yes gene_type:complete